MKLTNNATYTHIVAAHIAAAGILMKAFRLYETYNISCLGQQWCYARKGLACELCPDCFCIFTYWSVSVSLINSWQVNTSENYYTSWCTCSFIENQFYMQLLELCKVNSVFHSTSRFHNEVLLLKLIEKHIKNSFSPIFRKDFITESELKKEIIIKVDQ